MFHFTGEREGEQTIAVIRKHPIVYFKIILIFLLTVVLPLAVFLWLWSMKYPFGAYLSRGYVVLIFSSLYMMYGLLFSCIAWLNEEFDVLVLTNQRIMDITQLSLLRRSVASTPLDRIQDAKTHVSGFLQTVLNYGDLMVKTASGDATDIQIDRIPNPGDAARLIMETAHHSKTSPSADITPPKIQEQGLADDVPLT